VGTENLQTFNKIEPSSCFIKDRIIQIIGFSALLLWLAVYAIKVINFSEYADGSSLDVGSLIKSLLFLASFSFTLSIFLGIWIHYKTKNSSSNNQSKWIIKLIKWFTLGLLVLMMPIPLLLFPESDKLFAIFLIVLLFTVKYVRDKMLKKIGT
jgi:signal transduction histidine kinase